MACQCQFDYRNHQPAAAHYCTAAEVCQLLCCAVLCPLSTILLVLQLLTSTDQPTTSSHDIVHTSILLPQSPHLSSTCHSFPPRPSRSLNPYNVLSSVSFTSPLPSLPFTVMSYQPPPPQYGGHPPPGYQPQYGQPQPQYAQQQMPQQPTVRHTPTHLTHTLLHCPHNTDNTHSLTHSLRYIALSTLRSICCSDCGVQHGAVSTRRLSRRDRGQPANNNQSVDGDCILTSLLPPHSLSTYVSCCIVLYCC